MAPREHMTWDAKGRRWFKKYRGKMYAVSPKQLKREKSKEASRAAANAWWEAKQAEIDNQAKLKLQQVLEGNLQILQEMEDAKSSTKMGIPPLPASVKVNPDEPVFVSQLYASLPANKFIGPNVARWLERKRALANGGEITADRYTAYKYGVEYFQNWLGKARPVDAITTQSMEKYHNHLLELIALREADSAKKAGISRA
jgi:hypothetical protein